MARISVTLRNEQRRKVVARCRDKRVKLKEELRVAAAKQDFARVQDLQQQLQKLPRDASPIRLRNRCSQTGRPRGVYRKFGLCRNMVRHFAMAGDIPGLTKASW